MERKYFVERAIQTSTPSPPPDRALLHMFHTPGDIHKQSTDPLSHSAELHDLTAMCPFPCMYRDLQFPWPLKP